MMTISIIFTLLGIAYANTLVYKITGKNLIVSTIETNKTLVSVVTVLIVLGVLLFISKKRRKK